MTWGTGLVLNDKRFCHSCLTRRNPTGGEWVETGNRRHWNCGVCVGRRRTVHDAYEQTDRQADCCDLERLG